MKTLSIFGVSALLAVGGFALIQQSQAAKTSAKKPSKTVQKPKTRKGKVPRVLDFKMKSLDGKSVDLAGYKGKVVMFVNTASKCGFTAQYDGLQKLYAKYQKQGLIILGFPANDFGQQEPGSDAEIGAFCKKNYGVTFPMFSKIAVTGASKAPLYKFLTEEKTAAKFAGEIGWNFEKFLVARDGKIVGRFGSGVAPESDELVSAVKKELAKSAS